MKKATLLLILMLLTFILCAGCASDQVSIGIIGGADGPTTIFLAGKTVDENAAPARQMLQLLFIPAIILLMIVLAVVILLRIRRRSSKNRTEDGSPQAKPPGKD